MAFRIPLSSLSDEQQAKICKDLLLKEKKQFYQQHQYAKTKELRFYSVDHDTRDVLLPMYYASKMFSKPLINRSRKFHHISGFNMKTKLHEYQDEVVDISIKHFLQYGSTFLNVFCSFGKTVVAAYFSAMFSQQHGLVSLVTFPRDVIQSSWIGTFQDFTDAKIAIVGSSDHPIQDDTQVILCMDTRLCNIEPEIRKRVGHFVIDEADKYCTTGHIDGLLSVEPLFVTALTATYERDDGFEKMLDLICGPERITRISKRPFFVFKVPTEYEVEPRYGPKGVIFDSIVEQLDNIMERNAQIIQLVLDNLDEKILILTKHVPHATNLAVWLAKFLEPHNKAIALLAGKRSQYHDASVIIGTISKVGVGFDEKKACLDWKGVRINMLILTSSTKKIEQIAGRVFRADIPIIVDFVDNNKNIKNHWTVRKKWYESRNGIIYVARERFTWSQIKDNLLKDTSA